MSNLDGFGQFKAQTSAKVLLRPAIPNLFTRVFCFIPVLSIRYWYETSTGYGCSMNHFSSSSAPLGVNLGILSPGGPGGGGARPKKKQSEQDWWFRADRESLARVVVRAVLEYLGQSRSRELNPGHRRDSHVHYHCANLLNLAKVILARKRA